MAAVLGQLFFEELFLPSGVHKKQRALHYEVIMGSIAYSCSKNNSDVDLYGFAIPSKPIFSCRVQVVFLKFIEAKPSEEDFEQSTIGDYSPSGYRGEIRQYSLSGLVSIF